MLCWTASLKVAVTVLLTATFVAEAAGVRAVTVGGVVSAGGAATVLNFHDASSITLPAASLAAVT